MTFNSPLFGFRRFIYDTLGQVSQQRVNQIIQEGVKFQKNQPYNGDILTEEFQRFLNRLPKPISEQTVDQLVDKLLPYFSVRRSRQSYVYTVTNEETGDKTPTTGNTVKLVVNLGTPNKRVSFIPSFAEERENMDRPERHSDMSLFRDSFYNVKNNLVRVSIDRLREEVSGGVFKKSLQEFYKAFIEVLPIDIRLATPSQKLSFLRKLNLVASDDIYSMRNNREEMERNLTPLTSEGQIEKFTKEIATVKKNIRNLVPVGRVPLRETTKAIAKKLGGDYDLSKLGRMFVKGHALEDHLDERVSQREGSKTFGEWIYRAIFSTEGSRPFQNVQVDEDYVPLEEGEDSFFDTEPEITDTRQRVQELAPPKFNGRRFVFTSPNGDDIIYYSSGVINAEQVGRRLPEGYKLDREETIDDVMEYQSKQKADAKREERLKRKLSTSEVNIAEFYDNLNPMAEQIRRDAIAEQSRRKKTRGRKLQDRDISGRAVSPRLRTEYVPGDKGPTGRAGQIKVLNPSKFYFHPFDTDVELDPELFKMDLNELNPKERRRLKTFLQDADPTEFFGEEYLKLSKVINTLENIVGSSEEEELEGMDEENLKLIKKLAHLRKRYENLYRDIYEMVYGEEE